MEYLQNSFVEGSCGGDTWIQVWTANEGRVEYIQYMYQKM